jgi:nitroimidazol reductase NimA-like FMN-containing flavoprotein (pyridoxamine 5'-phosphate oxidase superfamily)
MIKTLEIEAMKQLLLEQKFGHLGCTLPGGEPYVVPVNYLYLDETIYLHSLPGKKLDAMRENNKICLQVEKIEDSCRWRSVIVSGEFEEIKRTNEKISVMQEFSKKFKNLTPVEAMIEEEWNLGAIVVFRINIKTITGIAET